MSDFLKTTLVFGIGAAVGAAVAVLLTPESGAELRQDVRRIAGEAKTKLQNYCEQQRARMQTAQAPETEEEA